MGKRNKRLKAKINSSSMADIAFLLLIFFLVTTTIVTHQGLSLKLPPEQENQSVEIHDRNLFKVLINSKNEILIEDERFQSFDRLTSDVKDFILNNGKSPNLSDHPEKAIVSLKVDRGTKYEMFISALDAIQGAYYEIYGSNLGITSEEYRNLKTNEPADREKYLAAREGIPMNISIAEPTNTK